MITKAKNNIELFVENVFENQRDVLGLEERIGQREFCNAIINSINTKENLLIEGGVGIGKTLAYLIPAIGFYFYMKRNVVIATSTIALQDQLNAEVIRLNKHIKQTIPIIVVKGQNNYVCRFRYENFKRSSEYRNRIHLEERLILNRFVREKGQINEGQIPTKIWNYVSIKEFNIKYCEKSCKYSRQCYYYEMRCALNTFSGIIICNQDFLAMDLVNKNLSQNTINISQDKYDLIPPYNLTIIDEAHNFESKVRNNAGEILVLDTILGDMKNVLSLFSVHDKNKSLWEKSIYEVFEKLNNKLDKQIAAQKKYRIEDVTLFKVDINDISKCITHFIQLLEMMKKFPILNNTIKNKSIYKRICNYHKALSILVGNKSYIACMQFDSTIKSIVINLYPKDISRIISNSLILRNKISIFVSGTLYNTSYEYFRKSIGFKGMEHLPIPSPFDYERNTMIYYTDNLCHPTKEINKYILEATKQIISLLNITKGKALILFTAKSDMQDVYNLLKKKNLPYTFIQQKNRLSEQEVERFKSNIDSVLLGIGSCWEGLSVEGVTLSNLIIFKLPFPLPDPIIDYKCSIESKALMKVQVPEMIIKLKQGVGRLVRNHNDKGIICILDSRVGDFQNLPYNQMIWNALPMKNRTSSLIEIKKFYGNLFEP